MPDFDMLLHPFRAPAGHPRDAFRLSAAPEPGRGIRQTWTCSEGHGHLRSFRNVQDRVTFIAWLDANRGWCPANG